MLFPALVYDVFQVWKIDAQFIQLYTVFVNLYMYLEILLENRRLVCGVQFRKYKLRNFISNKYYYDVDSSSLTFNVVTFLIVLL